MHRESSNHKGAVAEAKIAAQAIALGIPVLKPMSEHGRYDLVFDLGTRLLRVQCKWANRKGAVLVVQIGGNYLSPRGYVRSTYSPTEVDAVAAYSADLDECYLLPIELVAGHHLIRLRLAPARNAQRAALHWASEYRLSGAVAQLEERRRGTAEATGSSPVSSTQPGSAPGLHQLQADDFRRRFGWYMQRASAGEEFLISRRGRPYARLSPPHAQLAPAPDA